jgi:hypothetical protein
MGARARRSLPALDRQRIGALSARCGDEPGRPPSRIRHIPARIREFRAAAPALRQAVSLFASDSVSVGDRLRWSYAVGTIAARGGDFGAAAGLVAEANAVGEATGSRIPHPAPPRARPCPPALRRMAAPSGPPRRLGSSSGPLMTFCRPSVWRLLPNGPGESFWPRGNRPYHLGKVFAKLGISSRGQLHQVLPGGRDVSQRGVSPR